MWKMGAGYVGALCYLHNFSLNLDLPLNKKTKKVLKKAETGALGGHSGSPGLSMKLVDRYLAPPPHRLPRSARTEPM